MTMASDVPAPVEEVVTVEQIAELLAQGGRIEDAIALAVNKEAATREAVSALEKSQNKKRRVRFWFILGMLFVLAMAVFLDSRHRADQLHHTTCTNALSINRVVDEDQETLRDAQRRTESAPNITSEQLAAARDFYANRIASYERARPTLKGC